MGVMICKINIRKETSFVSKSDRPKNSLFLITLVLVFRERRGALEFLLSPKLSDLIPGFLQHRRYVVHFYPISTKWFDNFPKLFLIPPLTNATALGLASSYNSKEKILMINIHNRQ